MVSALTRGLLPERPQRLGEVLELATPLGNRECVLSRRHSRTHVSVRRAGIEGRVKLRGNHGVFLHVDARRVAPERPHDVRNVPRSTVRAHVR